MNWDFFALCFYTQSFADRISAWAFFRNGFQHLTHVISLNANCSYLSVILYDQMKGCVVLKVIRLIWHFWLRERESWIKLPSTQRSLSEILIFLCSVSTICWRDWLLPGKHADTAASEQLTSSLFRQPFKTCNSEVINTQSNQATRKSLLLYSRACVVDRGFDSQQ